ncbi:hypothetical protein DKY63_25090 [Pseudomonas putida]|uniref:Dermonecrotic toxin N-terminal domain-containing protein n=1 Tax=Pseudomonas putida TaxID=303 RepID=A0A2Z4RPH3_PSEPU|nr:DUF6543 domain-containing protein [Pseudomonas putida]AWY43010.1 hypothetical protein DKY63_25090 [Pseudomonas putida]
MTDGLLPDLSTPSSIAPPPFLPLPASVDERLLRSAWGGWNDSSLGLRQLFSDVPTASDRWNAYWDARAPGTPLSRRDRAAQLYREHFEAVTRLAFAQRTLGTVQFNTLSSLMGATTDADVSGRTEQLTLALSNGDTVKFPAAWVISANDAQPDACWLYFPYRPVAITAFAKRSEMEDWLLRQSLVPQGLPSTDIRFEYSARTQPLTAGITDLLSHYQQAQRPLLHAGAAFNLPPRLEMTPAIIENNHDDHPALFGNLYADIPWSLRQAALNMQREALDRHLGDDLDSDRHKKIAEQLVALQTAMQSADKAATALLYRARTLDLTTFNQQFTRLYQAHKAGLRAEARLQRTLEQLTEDEFRLINTVLDTHDGSDPAGDSVVASLSLTMTTRHGDQTSTLTQSLHGPWVIAPSGSPLNSASAHSVLLYWPGTGGGLLRFENLRTLERELLKIQDLDNRLALKLSRISADPVQYSLNEQTGDFELKVAQVRQRYPHESQISERADELEKLRRQALASLQVPVQTARQLAFSQRLEQDRSATLSTHLPDWLKHVRGDESVGLKALILAYIEAMRRSREQLDIALMPRHEFTRQHLHARLRKDFSIKGDFQVLLEMPDSVSWQKHLSPAPGAPGTPQKLVLVPSTARSKMPIEDLAQHNIDNSPSMNLEPLALRLSFMKVEISTADDSERQTLASAITLPWLRRILPELDLARDYETLIRNTFMGAGDEAAFVREHRRECLIEPWRLLLKLQGECARLQKQISHDDQQVFSIAIDADTEQAWRTDGKRLVLWPANLTVGGKDTPNEGPVTLAGVTFIEEQVSGMTLLYLPDSPDKQFLRRFDNLEMARKALYNLCLRDEMARYLAGRALQGSVQAHLSRINQAQLKHFDALIGIGTRWPSTTSLAAHQLDSHMGRLIEAHRATSRSNNDLYLERYALQGPRAFNYMKMALGLVPFVGTAIALYDAWNSANQAVAAFVRGEAGDGLAEVESVLLCLIDAAMDILPSASIGTTQGARSATRLRHLRGLNKGAAMSTTSLHEASRVVQRFAGYEYEKPLSLSSLQPATHGIYRNIYRHADGDFIVRQGRVFQVERSTDSRNWRLKGTTRKTYKQPIALDESGQWDTWFGVYGVAFEGGGLGGGNLLGHLADTLDPVWPQAVRERLPRWWVDEGFRRQHALTEGADSLALQIDARVKQTDTTLNTYNTTPAPNRTPTLLQQAETACMGDIELAGRYHQTLVDLLPLTHGNKRRALLEFQSNAALMLADRYKQRLFLANHRVNPLIDSIDALTQKLDDMPATALSERLGVLGDIRKLRLEMIKEFDTIDAHLRDLNHWYQRITVSAQKAQLTQEVAMLNGRMSEANMLYLKTGNWLELVTRYDTSNDLSWFFLQNQMRAKRSRVDRDLFTQYSLPEVSATKAQRNQILQECIENYREFSRSMNAWTASYPQHFDLDAVPLLLDGLAKMAERARKAINLPPPAAPAGHNSKKAFLTDTDQWLIGVEQWEPGSQTRRYTLTGQGGYTEIWEQGSHGKSRLLNPQPQPSHAQRRNLDSLLADARQRLQSQDAYQARIQSYADQDMLPVDLEHMMTSEANELTHRADGIAEIAPRNALVTQLRDKASELVATGRTLRTRQSLQSKKPTDGMLDDLVKHNVVEIRKTGLIKNLGKRRDGRIDYMQEYEVWDTTQAPPKVLWYAHFHYSKATPEFGGFEKAHLKLPEHRFLTHADNADLPYADIGKRSAALAHFENL